MKSFGERLVAAVDATGPCCAGVDPSAQLLADWDLPDDARGLAEFGARCVEAFAGVVPIIKPQVAFYERHGSAGLAALEALVAGARAAGLLVLADAKRGDFPNTMAAYAEAWVGDGPLAVDAVTATPYLGVGSLEPLFQLAEERGRGVFVVVRSSNPEGRGLQQAVRADGSSIEDSLLAELAARNTGSGRGPGGVLGSLGAVVGATLAPSDYPLSQVNGPFLAPGVGAQGGGPSEVAALFKGCRPGSILPSASRSLLALGPSVDALRTGARSMCDEYAAVLN